MTEDNFTFMKAAFPIAVSVLTHIQTKMIAESTNTNTTLIDDADTYDGMITSVMAPLLEKA